MIVDVHTHVFRPEKDFGPRLRSDLKRCGVDPAAWGNVAERHLITTEAADVAIVFGIQGAATGWHVPNDYVSKHVQAASGPLLFFCSVDPGPADFRNAL